MDLVDHGDLTFIIDETFDFGLSSFSDSREELDEDEQFISPVKQTEQLSTLNIDLNTSNTEPTSQQHVPNWSPLTAEKLEEITKEANRLAEQLELCALQEKENTDGQVSSLWVTCSSFSSEKDASILRLLQDDSKSKKSPRSPRRETYIVKDSPVKALLPTVDLDNVSPLVSPRGTLPKTSTPFRSAEHLSKSQSKRSRLEYPSREQEPKEQINRISTPQRLSKPSPRSSKPSPGGRPSSGKSRTPNNKPSSVAQGRKETTSLVVSSKSPRSRQQFCSSVVTAGRPDDTGKPITAINAKMLVNPRSNPDRMRTGIPKPISRLPVISSISKPVTGISKSISGNINPPQSQAKMVPGGKALPRPATVSNVQKGSKALVTQSRLQPPKKVTLPGTLRCLTAHKDDDSDRNPAFCSLKQNKDKGARIHSGCTVPGICSRPEVMSCSSPAQKVHTTSNSNLLRL